MDGESVKKSSLGLYPTVELTDNGRERPLADGNMALDNDQKTGILVIEDEAIARTIMKVQLARLGFPVSEAASATQALHLLQRQRFALALIDLQLPDLSGSALLQRIRRSSGPNRDLKAVAVSARTAPGQERRLRQAGFVAWLGKPVSAERLRPLVQTWLPHDRVAGDERSGTTGQDDRFVRIQNELQAKFLADLRVQLARIESALEHRHRRQAVEHVHKLHGAAGFCRFTELRRWAARLEIALREENDEDYRPIWRRLQREAEELLHRGLPENPESG